MMDKPSGQWSNLFERNHITLEGILEARQKLVQLARYWRRKAARAGTRGRRGALSDAQVARFGAGALV